MPDKKILCPCCNKMLTRQTVSKHKRGIGSRQAEFTALRAADNAASPSPSLSSEEEPPPLKRRHRQSASSDSSGSFHGIVSAVPATYPDARTAPLGDPAPSSSDENRSRAGIDSDGSSSVDLSDDENMTLDPTDLTDSDLSIVRAFAMRHMLRFSIKQYSGINEFGDTTFPSVKKTRRRMGQLSGVSPSYYDCCITSCICYTGDYAVLTVCPHCGEPRFDTRTGKPRQQFAYMPFTPRLKALYASRHSAERMRYRSQQPESHTRSPLHDYTDGEHYRCLRKERVVIDGKEQTFYYFSDGRDVALALSADGVCPFKNHKVSCWPLLLINLNLSPEERYKQENVISLGVVPGPKQPRELDSFLWPFLQEVLSVASGVEAYDAFEQHTFLLRAFVIIVLGDVPAISKLMCMKGVNGRSPCRFCTIHALPVPDAVGKHTCYLPHRRDRFPEQPSINISALPLRDHASMLDTAARVESARPMAADQLAKDSSIKGVALLSRVPGISFPRSFPCEFMHLVLLNVIPLLVSLYTTDFKGLGEGSGSYRLAPTVWEAIGAATKAAGDTIPGVYGRRVPDLSEPSGYRIAETWSVWALYIAPTLLQGRFRSDRYYEHFVDLVILINLCIKLEITHDEVDSIRAGFIDWVQKYEKYFYQYDPQRIATCTLMVHLLLHVADSIHAQGPLWVYWSFVMERYCGRLGPAVKSRKHPWASLTQFVLAEAQLRSVMGIYNLEETDLRHSTRGQALHTRTQIDGYPDCELIIPHRIADVDQHLREQIANTLSAWFTHSEHQDRIRPLIPPHLEEWGKVKRLGGGDMMHAADAVANEGRDMTYIRYEQMVDLLAEQGGESVYGLRTFYGQLRRILVLPISPALAHVLGPEAPRVVVFAVVQECDDLTPEDRAGLRFYKKMQTGTQLTNLKTVECVVGRVQRSKHRWAIVDRSDALSRVLFTGDVNDAVEDQ